MKNTERLIILITIFILTQFISGPVQADPPGMPGNHGSNGDAPPGGGAPIGSGVVIMVALAGAFASKKVYQTKLNS